MTPHGTTTRYTYYGCRCDKCRAAVAAAQRKWVAKVTKLPVPDYAPHGLYTTYNNYDCRCEECRAAKSVSNKKYSEARKKAAQ